MFMKKYLICLLALLCLYGLPVAAQQKKGKKPYTVVIDAGHGGKDAGAVGKMLREKDLNLAVSLLTGQYIKERFPEVNVVYTRQTDIFIPLQERADIVNRNSADLFICIHTNSTNGSSARGVETFVLGTDEQKMQNNLDVAMRENSVIQLEANYQSTYQGFNPRSTDSYIMFGLMQNAYMEQSLQYAEKVQQQMTRKLGRYDRGVRQAAFWVLLKSACPSVLFEMGFVSNPDEERWLASKDNQSQIAHALCDAFAAYYHPSSVNATPQGKVLSEAELMSKVTQDKQAAREAEQQKLEAARRQQAEQQSWTQYGVQVLASKVELSADDAKFKGLKCASFQANGWYKYYVGPFPSSAEAEQKRREIMSLFPDCWVVKVPVEKQ